jgi:hypothetical protein
VALFAALMAAPTIATADDFGFEAFPDGAGSNLPGSNIAVGPEHLVGVLHNEVRFFTRAGEIVYESTFSGSNGFFPNAGTVFDSQALFDPHTHRFFVAGVHRIGFEEFLTIAVSDDADPTGEWFRQTLEIDAINGVPTWTIDQPTLGVDADAVHVTIDSYFGGDPQDPLSAGFILSYDKSALLAGEDATITAVEPFMFPVAPGTAKNYDADAPAQYFVTPFGVPIGSNQLMLFALTDAIEDPQVTQLMIEVPPFRTVNPFVHTVPQADSNVELTIPDSRTKRSVYRDGSLWTAHHVRRPGESRAFIRWYEISMNGWPMSGDEPELMQTGEIDLGEDIYTFMADVAVDAAGNAGFIYNRSSPVELPSVGRAFRLASDPPGTVQGIQTVHSSTTPSYGSGWGKYSSIDADESDPGSFWGTGTFRRTNMYGGISPATWCGRFVTQAPVEGDVTGDNVVDVEDLLAVLAAWGDIGGFPEDVNGDGVIDVDDLLIVLANWA